MIKQTLSGLVVLAGVSAAGISIGAAQTTNCIGTLAPGSYAAVNVPPGQSCFMPTGAVTVAGNVTVGTGAMLISNRLSQLTVNGSLLGMNALSVQIGTPEAATNILGSVSLTGMTGFTDIISSFVGGTVLVTNSNGFSIVLQESNVAGSVLVSNNKTNSVPNIVLQSSTIGGSLVCTGNTPAPVDGGMPNTVGGAKVGQCSGL